MAKLSYYPELTDLHGKQKIYFACHPDDFDTYFKPVCADLLAGNRNCVVFYNSERNVPWKSGIMKFELEQMQLMVIPVTAKFLCKSSEVRDVELPFIMNNTDRKIPILPLMQESGLDTEYSRIFHDLQYLDKNASMTDPTALPYEQKLKNYLDSIIFSPELIKKIREAFDAYIFLSYRKMDRVYAQNLMKLIHKNNFCRDIAIWYDEFLTPGEGFTKAIDDVLTKSDLFTLVVTPNILKLNDMGYENYVVDKEYPAAVKSGKPILPVSMQETDLEALHKKLDNAVGEDVFPTPTDGENAEALSQALQDKLPQDLLERLHAIAIDENNTDPQHNFFIGLAYLGGIDMEVDHEKAVQLITSAAEQNLPEAMEKLADMYKNGEGVTRNYETSAQWLDKLVEYWEKRFEETGAEEDGKKFLLALESSGNQWQSVGQMACALIKYEKMISVAKDLHADFGGCEYLAVLSISYSRIGHIYESKENFSEARKFYEKELEISKQFAKEDKTGGFLKIESRVYVDMGYICESEKNFSKAKEWFKKDLAICELLAKTKMAEFIQELSGSYVRLGDVCKLNGDISEAREWYEKAREIIEQLDKETGTVETRQDLCEVYGRLADICITEVRPAKAKEFYKKCLKISMQLVKELATVDAYERLSEVYFKCALVDTPSVSIYYLKKSEEICASLVKKCPDVVRLSHNLRQVRSTIDLVGQLGLSPVDKSPAKKSEGICTTPVEHNSNVDKDSVQSEYVRIRIRVKPKPNSNKNRPKHKG